MVVTVRMFVTIAIGVVTMTPCHRGEGGKAVHSGGDVGTLGRAPGATPPQRRLLSAAVTSHGKPELLGHLGAQTLPVIHGVLTTVPAELEDSHHYGQSQSTQQHHEHSANVLNTQRVSLGVLALVLGKK